METSVATVTQLPLQLVVPSGHAPRAQDPAEHTKPAPQTTPQAPQLAASEVRATHRPPHATWPAGQAHRPAAQVCPVAAHTTPQAPQFEGSAAVKTQRPPQSDWPLGHAHTLPTQAWPAPQLRPQAPQLAASLVVVTHRPEQTTWPGAQMHEPLVHD